MIDNSGYTYCHEHLHIDLSPQKGDIDCRLDQYQLVRQEMQQLITLGVRNIVEVTNHFMGRNPHFIEDLISDTGINVLLSTGYYIDGFFPPEVERLSASALAKKMVNEIVTGIDGSRLKASVIGEIGSSDGRFTELEQKVFHAAAMAHLETGRPISTHQSLSTLGKQQAILLQKLGVDLERVTIGHCDLKSNLDEIQWLIDQGCYVQFDTIGKNSYFPDSERLAMLQQLSQRGCLDRVMLSMDITRRSHLKANGGLGFAYLVDSFLPELLNHGVSQAEIDAMMIHTPYQVFK